MLLFAIPVCDLCKATARYGKETDTGETLECNGCGKSNTRSENALSKTNSQLRLSGLLESHCGADVRRFYGNANCDEAQALTF